MLLSIDAQEAEGRHADEPLETLDPEALFERRWASRSWSARDSAPARVRRDRPDGRIRAARSVADRQRAQGACKSAAERLGTTEGAIKKMVHRLRRRTVFCCGRKSRPPWQIEEIDAELRHLLATVRPWEPAAS